MSLSVFMCVCVEAFSCDIYIYIYIYIYIGNELVLTELIFDGVFKDLSPEVLLMCC